MVEKRQREDLGSLRRLQAVPFGIRAIESGIEVDGVWISRQQSVVTVPLSAKSSSMSEQSPTSSPPNGQVETSGSSTPLRDSTVLGSHGVPTAIRESTYPYSSAAGNPGSYENGPISNPGIETRSGRQPAVPAEQQQPSKVALHQHSSSDHVVHHKKSLTNSMGETVESTHPRRSRKSPPPSSYTEPQSKRPRSKLHSRPSSIITSVPSRSGKSESDSLQSPTYEPTTGENSTMSEGERSEGSHALKLPREPLQVRYPRAFNGQEVCEVLPRSPIDARPFLEGRKGNLDFLHTKRKPHAAETGQLTPRSKRATMVDQGGQPVRTSSEDEYFVGHGANGSAMSSIADPFKSPGQSCHTSTVRMPSTPWSESQTPRVPMRQDDISSTIGLALPHGPEPPITRSSVVEASEEPRSFHGHPSFEPRVKANTAVRRVNSAFEVLPAGTFQLQEAPPESDGRKSLDQDGRPKKLQKKNRSRSNSVAKDSVFTENL
jgi:hypothetical protein